MRRHRPSLFRSRSRRSRSPRSGGRSRSASWRRQREDSLSPPRPSYDTPAGGRRPTPLARSIAMKALSIVKRGNLTAVHRDERRSASSRESQSPAEVKEVLPDRIRYYKTRMCKLYLEGKCSNGERCSYAHSKEELVTASQNERDCGYKGVLQRRTPRGVLPGTLHRRRPEVRPPIRRRSPSRTPSNDRRRQPVARAKCAVRKRPPLKMVDTAAQAIEDGDAKSRQRSTSHASDSASEGRRGRGAVRQKSRARSKKSAPTSSVSSDDGGGQEARAKRQSPSRSPSPPNQAEAAAEARPEPSAASGSPDGRQSPLLGPIPEGAQAVLVQNCSDEKIAEGVHGTYVPFASCHGRPAYKSEEPSKGFIAYMYYWDGRDGSDYSGWWVGPTLGGDEIWIRHPDGSSLLPPVRGWYSPHDGPLDETMTVTPVGAALAIQDGDAAPSKLPTPAAGETAEPALLALPADAADPEQPPRVEKEEPPSPPTASGEPAAPAEAAEVEAPPEVEPEPAASSTTPPEQAAAPEQHDRTAGDAEAADAKAADKAAPAKAGSPETKVTFGRPTPRTRHRKSKAGAAVSEPRRKRCRGESDEEDVSESTASGSTSPQHVSQNSRSMRSPSPSAEDMDISAIEKRLMQCSKEGDDQMQQFQMLQEKMVERRKREERLLRLMRGLTESSGTAAKAKAKAKPKEPKEPSTGGTGRGSDRGSGDAMERAEERQGSGTGRGSDRGSGDAMERAEERQGSGQGSGQRSGRGSGRSSGRGTVTKFGALATAAAKAAAKDSKAGGTATKFGALAKAHGATARRDT